MLIIKKTLLLLLLLLPPIIIIIIIIMNRLTVNKKNEMKCYFCTVRKSENAVI